MQTIVLTPEHTIPGETDRVNGLFAGGLQRLHIRKPGYSITEYRDYIAAIDPAHHHLLVIHNYYELYYELGLAGIHLNSTARTDEATWQQLGNIPPSVISTSFHSWQEIIDSTFPYAYVFISPVFNSISKAGYNAAIDLHGALTIKAQMIAENRYCPKIIGLGGVGEKELAILEKYGFDGGAMLGSIWSGL